MYKIASDRRQSSLHRGRATDWISGDERLSPHDRLKQLQDGTKILDARILQAATPTEKKALGVEKLGLQNQIKDLRASLPKAPPSWKEHFVNEAKRILSASQFQMIERAAKIEAEREQAKRDKAEEETHQ